MTARVIRFVATAADAPPAATGVESIVLDTTWTPSRGDRSDVRPLRPVLVEVLRRSDPLAEAMGRLDAWAAASDLAARLEVDGVSLWWRRRLVYWRALHDRLIWRWVIAALASEGPIGALELTTDVPELRDVGQAAAAAAEWRFTAPAPPPPVPASPPRRRLPWPIDPVLWRLGLHPAQRGRPTGADARAAAAADATRWLTIRDRVRDLGRERGRLLVLTAPGTHQSIVRDGTSATIDPFLGSVVDLLRGTALEPIILELGSAGRALAPPDGGDRQLARTLPGAILGRLFADPADDAAIDSIRDRIGARLAEPFPPLDADGIDLGPWIVDGLRAYGRSGLGSELRAARRIERFLGALGPAAILTINEYSRPEWLSAADRSGIPVVAVQHGIIHPRHAGYVLPSRAGLPLATVTHVFGEYERRVLTGSSVYRPDEVKVSGAPRLDLVPTGAASATERAAVRDRLRVGPGDRLVVFSSTSSAVIRSTVIAAAFDTLLDGPWPAVHLVVKLHPAEDDDGFYPALIERIAAARGFDPPATTIVKAIDLYVLLRAADAHLGVYSTVLTDAVAAGTPNLIVAGLRGTDLLGYVEAGVARPVRSAAELLAELADPPEPAVAAAARAAFLADHFAAGPSSRRIADDLLARTGGPRGER